MLRCLLAAASLVLALQDAAPALRLEIRVFDAREEVSAETRVTVYPAGSRTTPVAQVEGRAGGIAIDVPQGIYDVQAIREREGRVVSIRWAERLVVMPYPDEGGRHLEVVNFSNGFGALQIRAASAEALDAVAVFAEGARDREAGAAVRGEGYRLFVLPAGRYEIRTGSKERHVWHPAVDVPLDRTRLWIVP